MPILQNIESSGIKSTDSKERCAKIGIKSLRCEEKKCLTSWANLPYRPVKSLLRITTDDTKPRSNVAKTPSRMALTLHSSMLRKKRKKLLILPKSSAVTEGARLA